MTDHRQKLNLAVDCGLIEFRAQFVQVWARGKNVTDLQKERRSAGKV